MDSIIGFDKEREYLINSYKKNNLNNSIIISGQKGIGKNYFLKLFIKEIFTMSIQSNNLDHHLNLIDTNSHPNVKYLSREIDEKTKKIKKYITIDQIRNLKNFSYVSSSIEDLIKVVIIDSADEMNLNASNSILKLLEEPKKNTFFFLISHQLSSLLPTIRSRCLKIKFHNHTFDNFQLILKDQFGKNNLENIKFLYDISNGSPGIAIQFDDKEIIDIFDDTVDSVASKVPLSKKNIELSSKISEFENEKFQTYISVLKFILLNLSKIKIDMNALDQFVSNKIKKLIIRSENISQKTIIKKLEYLIKNENDLFTYNLDKKFFLLNFFSEIE
ncbi:MAG: hypothetical protein CFH15_00992 [Alphaproteobacteria bacterium MarineAlpha5_Bin5]|mgnify:CR=1 FL=1|nr:MAG: hypothetical protein CFH15_00992 [Alphaproteobacteria bacterium MarineAlpha5_Bin5]PPR51521.1 MAG: hypothetical protein CFH14_00677 [Alphaproteobacteria bacterium MarineAlpha5_Bin4]|tara:strand:+ start:5822 stop:6814 length:993 start_codon:yes stop_codon:yes gene_type:complete